jgi:hypothetical protein
MSGALNPTSHRLVLMTASVASYGCWSGWGSSPINYTRVEDPSLFGDSTQEFEKYQTWRDVSPIARDEKHVPMLANEQIDPAEAIDAMEHNDPIEPMENELPMEPIENELPMEPMEQNDPIEPMERALPSEPTDRHELE